MVRAGLSFTCLVTGALLAAAVLPELLLASPAGQRLKGDAGDASEATAIVSSPLKKLVRSRRNISWYKQHSDFWSWYKYFTDTGNQAGVQELDRLYLAYLQNKNRAEGRRSYNLYLQHLGEIYKSCAKSDDPNCVASYTSKPASKPEAPKVAPVKACDPYRDPYCLASKTYPYTAPAPVRAPLAVKSPGLGQYYYAPVVQPFLSAQQQAELLRICDAKDVECLQYHLRAAYGYKPARGPLPSYAHLGCDPKNDPGCRPALVQKAPSGYYHRYPTCDPNYDPYCLPHAAQKQEAAPLSERPCNPLVDNGCNPLTATKLASLSPGGQKADPSGEPAPGAPCDPRYDPNCLYRTAAAMQMRPPPQLRAEEEPRHRLGPRGKTKEGYDCYMFYDEECRPLGVQSDARASRLEVPARPPAARESGGADCHPYDPYCGARSTRPQAAAEAFEPHLNPDGTRRGVIEPDPDCDPEYDRNCRLRRVEEPKRQAVSADAAPEEDRTPEEQRDEYHPQGEPNQATPSYDHQPETPGYDSRRYDHQPETPGYDSRRYDHQPETPGYDSRRYDHQPETPGYDSRRYDHQPETPGYDSRRYDHQPETPGYDSRHYEQSPETPGYDSRHYEQSPDAPGYDQHNYEQSPDAPGYDQHNYEQSPDAPGYDQHNYEPYQSGQGDPYANYGPQDHAPQQFEDVMPGRGEAYARYEDSQDHRAYSGEYRKK